MLLIDPLEEPPDIRLTLPGSKSITNRALVTAALANGESVLSGALFADDTFAMVDSLRKFGVEIKTDQASSSMTIKGSGGALIAPDETLWVNQSGTTARFCLPLAALVGSDVVIDGDQQIKSRPHRELFDAITFLGVDIEYLDVPYQFPVRVNGDKITGGKIILKGDTSSQFLSALLLSAPLFEEELHIAIEGDLVSTPYANMTLAVMEAFGVRVAQHSGQQYSVPIGGYAATQYQIEPDASAASYFFAAAAVSGGTVSVEGLGSLSIQGDVHFLDILEKMGAKVIRSDDSFIVSGPDKLTGIDVSMSSISDTVPTLAAIAPFATGPVTIRDVAFISKKESDRVSALITELLNLGVQAETVDTGLIIYPGIPHGGIVNSYDDHRIAMSFSIMGLFTDGLVVDPHRCVAKTFPEFYEVLDQIRMRGDGNLAVLAIDGPAGSGKSTLAKYLAKQLGLEYLDTGAMYRSVAAVTIKSGIDIGDKNAVAEIAEGILIEFDGGKIFVDGEDMTEIIRGADVNAAVSEVAANTGVRAVMRRRQRAWARARGGGVLEGRDIGSVVFPNARLKVYVTATPEERAKRRSLESGRTIEDITEEILGRDTKDSTRFDSPLVADSEAIVIDTTGKTIEETADYIQKLFR
jgi:3-phosphoshikimate 1-carboxyvinyltransferase